MDTEDVDNDDLDVALSSNVTCFRAAVPFTDVIRDKESKEKCKNRLKDYFITKYTEDFLNLQYIGKAAVRKVVLIFATAEVRNQALIDEHDELKATEESVAPIFHSYDPAAINAAKRVRTITVTDIPLFFSASELTSSFKKYGIIDDYKFRTPKGSNFQQADIIFEDPEAVQRFATTSKWCIWSQGHCLRVCPAALSRDEKQYRMTHVAVLKNLPPDIKP